MEAENTENEWYRSKDKNGRREDVRQEQVC